MNPVELAFTLLGVFVLIVGLTLLAYSFMARGRVVLTVQCAIYLAEVLPGTMTVEHIDVTESLLAGQELILRRLARERDLISHSVALIHHPLTDRGWVVEFQIRQRNFPRWKEESSKELPPVIVMLSGYLKAHFDLWVVELE